MAIRHLNPPSICDLCGNSFGNIFYDFKTKAGPWANGCTGCFNRHQGVLGHGRGQKFVKHDDGHFYKEA